MCVPFEVTVVADDWPQEISWTLKNETGDVVAEGTHDDLVPGEPFVWLDCINKKECYEFTINDTGGDGVCCDHGNGSYKVKFDGKDVKNGAAFYDYETTALGRCGETPVPTNHPTVDASIKAPTIAPKFTRPTTIVSSGSSPPGAKAFRCVPNQLVGEGYTVSGRLCDKFTDCYNKWIDVGDDFFCNDGEECIEAPACSDGDVLAISGNPPVIKPTKSSYQPSTRLPSKSPTATAGKRPIYPPNAGRPARPTTAAKLPVIQVPVTSVPTARPTVGITSELTKGRTDELTGNPTEHPSSFPSSGGTTLSPTQNTTWPPTIVSVAI